MFSKFFALFFFTSVVFGQTCPIRCPSCMKCDPKRGTCTVPRDYVSCFTKTSPSCQVIVMLERVIHKYLYYLLYL